VYRSSLTGISPVQLSGEWLIPADATFEIVEDFLTVAARRTWSPLVDIEWSAIRADLLTDNERDAIKFLTVIEDHLPGYFAAYNRRLPVDDTVDLISYVNNREFYRFTSRWAQEEELHAYALYRYQIEAGLENAAGLRAELALAGRQAFDVPYAEPVQVFTYTLIQEKVTQLYYLQLSERVAEPVLRRLLRLLARDEGRHFVFFFDIMGAYIRTFGGELLPSMKDVVQTFRMPLADTLDRYWRGALAAARAAGGPDHTKAFEEVVRLIQRSGDAATRSRSLDLVNLIRCLRRS
jgi:acyl-[acyl-carrier-protein] desaturase